MNKSWLLVILGAILEIGWVTGLAHATSIGEWAITIISVILSYGLFTMAAKELPMGTLYAVYTGLGTVGTILTGIWLFDEAIYPLKAFLMISLLVGIVGLKMVETKKEV
ncbi:SMR family transporter [Carnobacterium divergens]|uniref:SMR family transporter n=1 Tax=Carnobacterium divergens TaxID=2748 RepID=A0AAW8R4V6_CARDV|nr:SMR family transporter [Carnobacterium divergens]MDT1956814.1 SMR family transporter [Carnobacterium divergens]MDT1972784.1 SMR family transporter [Carnobacterium divergens]